MYTFISAVVSFQWEFERLRISDKGERFYCTVFIWFKLVMQMCLVDQFYDI